MILIVFSHPYTRRSHANKAILSQLEENEHVQISNLYEKYPDFHINIEEEQALLRKAKLIIFQFPLYWYNVPALFKQWQEVVLTKQFALDDKSSIHALRGKVAMAVVTTGHKHKSYQLEGYDNYTLDDFLRPLEQMSIHCGMHYHAPLVLHQAHRSTTAKLIEFGELYNQRINQLYQQSDVDSVVNSDNNSDFIIGISDE